jgi:hypothetical protein
VPASLALHIGLGIIVLLLPDARQRERPPQEGIAVEILTPGQFEASDRPPGVQPDTAILSAPPGLETEGEALPPCGLIAGPGTRLPAMIRATRFLAARSLADPASKQARLALLQLAGSDSMEQLCAVEAMDQIHAWRDDLRPDRLVAYAMADTEVAGNTILADGGAFRSGAQWFNVKYRCEVTPDHETVVSFEFLVGDPVPRQEWERRNLPAVH